MVKENTAYREQTKNRELQQRVDALRSIPLFFQMSEDECRRVAEHLVYAPFAQGDTLTRQGAVAHWLYIVISGEVDVIVETAAGVRRQLATLGAGEFFGEMGLLTGEPRAATIIAKTDTECYRLDKPGFAEIIRDRPAIAEEVSNILAARLQRNLQTLEQDRQGGENETATLRSAIVGKIRAFFNLR